MSVSELYDRVAELEHRLGLQSEGLDYSTRLLILLDRLDAPAVEDEPDPVPDLDAGALEKHINRLQDIVGDTSLEVTEYLKGSIEEIMARLEDQLEMAVHLHD